MNYCSLEDAWGSNNRMCSQYKNYMDNKHNIESDINKNQTVNNNTQSNSLLKQNIEQFSDISYESPHKIQNDFHELNDCDNFLNHIRTCKKCHNKVKNYFKPKLVENIQNIVEDNKDTIVLILIGISILLFFNLINNMTKSK
jgi:16S rRNA C1402 (ribose-2'-O) methylase RsmI